MSAFPSFVGFEPPAPTERRWPLVDTSHEAEEQGTAMRGQRERAAATSRLASRVATGGAVAALPAALTSSVLAFFCLALTATALGIVQWNDHVQNRFDRREQRRSRFDSQTLEETAEPLAERVPEAIGSDGEATVTEIAVLPTPLGVGEPVDRLEPGAATSPATDTARLRRERDVMQRTIASLLAQLQETSMSRCNPEPP